MRVPTGNTAMTDGMAAARERPRQVTPTLIVAVRLQAHRTLCRVIARLFWSSPLLLRHVLCSRQVSLLASDEVLVMLRESAQQHVRLMRFSLDLSRACLEKTGRFFYFTASASQRFKSHLIVCRACSGSGSPSCSSSLIRLAWQMGLFSSAPAKNGTFEPFIYKNDELAKTGSGQT
jgi:hypothetical protein